MLGDTQRRRLEDCPNCNTPMDVTDEQPLARLPCPSCNRLVTVRAKFNQFVIQKKIGEGGMSRVFLAEDRSLGRKVALKILNRKFSQDEERVAQFEKEARITALVSHPNVVRIYSVGRAQGFFFIAMELVSGGSLEARIKDEKSIPERELMPLAVGMVKGLRAAHHAGLVHRDIKPGNILFSDAMVPKIVDFGLSLVYKTDVDTSGEIWATPFYVPPEKLNNRPDSFRGDIYSLGATLYHALVGNPPHPAETNSIEKLKKIKAEAVDLAAAVPNVSRETVLVINRMLKRDPGQRQEDYDELLEETLLSVTKMENPDKVSFTADLSSTSRFSTQDPDTMRLFWIGGTLAALALVFGLFALFRGPAGSRGQKILTKGSGGGEITTPAALPVAPIAAPEPEAGLSIGDRFLEARENLFKGELAVAKKTFRDIAKSDAAAAPTRRWALFNIALCYQLEGESEAARNQFSVISKTLDGAEEEEEDNRMFFRALCEEMLRGSMPVDEVKSRFKRDSAESLGFIALGLRAWQFGDWDTALSFFDTFELADRSEDIGWVDRYGTLLPDYYHDYELILSEPIVSRDLDFDELKAAREGYGVLGSKILTRGRARRRIGRRVAWLDGFEKTLESGEAVEDGMRVQVIDKTELAELQEIVMALRRENYQQGYRFAEAANALGRAAEDFESDLVRDAAGQHIYLWEQADAFIDQLVEDLNGDVYTKLSQEPLVEGSDEAPNPLGFEGEIVRATREYLTLRLDYGESRFTVTDIPPAALVAIADRIAERTPDSNEHYRRRELVVAFAHMTMAEDGWRYADPLMEENRRFRERWIQVLEACAR